MDLLAGLTVWDLDIVLLVAVVRQQVKETVLGDVELELPANHQYHGPCLAILIFLCMNSQAGTPDA